MRMFEHDDVDAGYARIVRSFQRPRDAKSHHVARVLVANDANSALEADRRHELGFPAVERVSDHDALVGHPTRLAGLRIDPAAGDHVVDQRGPARHLSPRSWIAERMAAFRAAASPCRAATIATPV